MEREITYRRPLLTFPVVAALIIGFLGGIYRAEILNLAMRALGRKVDSAPLSFDSLQGVYNGIYSNFDGEIDRQKLIEGASRGMVEALGDDHTVFMTDEEYEEYGNALEGEVGVGIGIEVGRKNGAPTVLRSLKDNPAIKAGVKSGDVIVAVNDEDVSKSSIKELTDKIKGEENTTVKIKILRNGEIKEFSIVRQKINNPSVELDFDGDVAILTISRFDNETGALARKYAQEIVSKNSSKVILDLRENGGGYVTAAQAVASLWLDAGQTVVVQKEGEKITDTTRATGNNILANIKTVVLGDENSASASEIVIGALRTHNKAKFYGVRTYGKGSVQTIVKVSGGYVKVTVAKWYTPDDKNIDGDGIEPDVVVELSESDFNAGRDPQMSAAKKAE